MPTTARLPRDRIDTAWAVYREIHFCTLAAKTRAEYTSAVRHALAALPCQIGAADVLRWHRGLLARYSTTYANQCLHTLRTIARRAAIITGDHELSAIVWQVLPVREAVRAPRCPPRDTLRLSLELCGSLGERLWVMLAGLAGLRRGEILGLLPTDWDPVAGSLRVERQRRSPTRKNRRPHSVRVDHPDLRVAIEWAIENHDGMRARTGWWRGGERYLFPWSLRRAEGLLARLRDGLPPGYLPRRQGWHAFRHWGATELARSGASVWDVQAWLGDSDPKMATRYVAMVRGETSGSVALLANRGLCA